jgi:hypothetical protein
MIAVPSRTSRLTLLSAVASLLLGLAAVGLGIQEDSVAAWGFGAACLLQVPPGLTVWHRVRQGLGNRGLERERVTLRVVSHVLGLLALGMSLAALSAWMGGRTPQSSPATLGLAFLALGSLMSLWLAKRGLADLHPALEQDATRGRVLVELASLLLLGALLGRSLPWADAVAGLGMALRIFLLSRALAKGTAVAAACGGCGSCGCG